MGYKLRDNNEDSGQWLSFLLPLCLLPLTVKSQFAVDKLAIAVITWLSISQVIKQSIYLKKRSGFDTHYVFHAVLSIPASFGISWITSCDIVNLYLICLAAVLSYNYLISKLLVNCHGSFTLGEVQIIAQGIILFVFYSINSLKQLNEHISYRTKHVEAVDLIQLLLLGLLSLVCCLYMAPNARKGIQFHFICFSFVTFMMLIWGFFHRQNVIIWLFEFCTYKRRRIYLLLFWSTATLASMAFVVWVNQRPSYTASALYRKYFHFIINAVYIPGVIYDVQFLCFASGIALGVFIVLEIYRVLDIPIVGQAIGEAFQIFLDEKDSGVLILTHTYLLIGCSCPVWLSSEYVKKSEYHISLMSGIISVGFGDTFAAIGGTLFGKHFWKGSKKTVEGTVCAIITQLVCSLYFVYLGYHFSFFNISLVIISVLLTSLLEAKTNHVDNLVLPLFMFSFLSWID